MNKNNAVHAIVFEAVAVAIALDEPELMAMGVALLAKFLSVSTGTAQLCTFLCLAALRCCTAQVSCRCSILLSCWTCAVQLHRTLRTAARASHQCCPGLASVKHLPNPVSLANPPPQVREPNLKYLALENMARLAEVPAVVDTGACVLCRRGCGWCASCTMPCLPNQMQAIRAIWALSGSLPDLLPQSTGTRKRSWRACATVTCPSAAAPWTCSSSCGLFWGAVVQEGA